jgi:hypothetical protein
LCSGNKLLYYLSIYKFELSLFGEGYFGDIISLF